MSAGTTLKKWVVLPLIAIGGVWFGWAMLLGRPDVTRPATWQAMASPGPLSSGHAFLASNCAACHMVFNFSDNGFHNIGVKDMGAPDAGRFAQRKVKAMQGACKTPTLRDVALTAPYMRNGSYKTLMEVVEHYDRGGDDKSNLDVNMAPLALTAAEKAELVAFMESLTGAPRLVSVPVLPQ